MSNHTPIQLPLPMDGETFDLPLTHGFVTQIDAIDGDLGRFNWHAKKRRASWVAARTLHLGNKISKTQLLHRVILERKLGRELAPGEECDHADLNPLNNRRSNLRLASGTQNMYNTPSRNNKTGFKGVAFHKERAVRPWSAGIGYQGKTIALGYFSTPEEAHEVYCERGLSLDIRY